ncbi:MAG: phosphoethanolamine--lipid A transferase [Bdellovibrio sp.]|nr:phosphoethanolamine--lipid A transferase [Methylotenera sp.]
MSRFNIKPGYLVVLVSLWLASVCNAGLWLGIWRLPEIVGFKGVAFMLGFFVFILGLQIAFLSLFAWGKLLKPVLIFVLIYAALGAYFMLSYGVVVDKSMLVNVLQTDLRESKELFSLQLVLVLGLMALLPILLLWRVKVQSAPFFAQLKSNLLLMLLAIVMAVAAVMLTFQSTASVMRNHKALRFMINPLNSVYALGLIVAEPFTRAKLAMQAIGQDATVGASWQSNKKPALLIVVVGETARAANFSLNGYARDTNPELALAQVANFSNVHSCGTSTAASVPCMFSHLGREAYNKRTANYESLLPVLKHAGLGVLWRDNNAGCKGVCSIEPAEYDDMSRLSVAGLCENEACFDEILLHQLDERVASALKDRKTSKANGMVIFMHQMGSHGPAYYLRSPQAYKKFMPECTSNNLQDCNQQQVINAYDNTILYTDHFLAQTIKWLNSHANQYDTAMLYVSDHGESLGENNTYLHGLPYMIAPDVQKHVPMVVWLSPQMQTRTGVSIACLQQQKELALSHDNLFHSVLGLLDVHTTVYREALDLFAPCSKK